MAGLSEAEIDFYAKDIQGKIDTMIALTPYFVPTAEQKAALSSGKMVSTDYFPISDATAAQYDVLTAAAQNKVTTVQLVKAGYVEDTPQAIKDFEDKVSVKKALIPYRDNAVDAVMNKAVTIDQVASIGYDKKQVQTAVDTLTTLKDYYVPETKQQTIAMKGLVPIVGEEVIPAGYNIHQARIDGKVTSQQLFDNNFITDIPKFEAEVSTYQRVQQTMNYMDAHYAVDGGYNIDQAIYDRIKGDSPINAGNL